MLSVVVSSKTYAINSLSQRTVASPQITPLPVVPVGACPLSTLSTPLQPAMQAHI